MRKSFLAALLLLASAALPVSAQKWSIAVGSGPFAFGDFVERTVVASTGAGAPDVSKIIMSARMRPGIVVDLERSFSERFAMRLEASFTESPVSVKTEGSDEGVGLEAGTVDIGTFMLPLVFRINPNGSVRFHLLAGPANAVYHVRRRSTGPTQIAIFEGTRSRWGVAAGLGASWWWSDRFAVEGQITDISTSSPFERSDFAANHNIDIPRTHNVHTTVGVRWKF